MNVGYRWLVGLDVRLALLALESVVLVPQPLILVPQLANRRLQVFGQVEQLRDGAARTSEVLDAVQINLRQRLGRSGHGWTTDRSR